MVTTGNHRNSRAPTADHKLILVKGTPPAPVEGLEISDSAANTQLALVILFVVFLLLAVGLCVYVVVLYQDIKSGGSSGAQEAPDKINAEGGSSERKKLNANDRVVVPEEL